MAKKGEHETCALIAHRRQTSPRLFLAGRYRRKYLRQWWSTRPRGRSKALRRKGCVGAARRRFGSVPGRRTSAYQPRAARLRRVVFSVFSAFEKLGLVVCALLTPLQRMLRRGRRVTKPHLRSQNCAGSDHLCGGAQYADRWRDAWHAAQQERQQDALEPECGLQHRRVYRSPDRLRSLMTLRSLMILRSLETLRPRDLLSMRNHRDHELSALMGSSASRCKAKEHGER